MTITVSQISALVGRYTNSIVNEQTNSEVPFVGKGALKKIKKKDKVGVVNIKSGELSSATFIADAGTLPDGTDVQPVQGTYLPAALFARISIPRVAAHLASSLEDGIQLVQEEMESAGRTVGRILGRAVAGAQIGAPLATINTTSTTFEVLSPGAWRVGMAFEVWNGGTAIEGNTQSTLLKVTNVDIPADGVGNTTITFTGSGGGGGNAVQWLTSYSFYLRGAKSNPMVSMADVHAAASLYGVAHTGNDWKGNLDSTTTTVGVEAMRAMLTTIRRRSNSKPTHIVCNSKNGERYSNRLLNNRRFMSGKMDAVGDAGYEFEGIPFVLDDNFDDADMYYHNDKDVKLHVFRETSPDFDGMETKAMGKAAMLISDSSLIYDTQLLGIYNLRVERRNSGGRFSALAA